MSISIALRFAPFSHSPGTCCLIPFSTWQVQVFPAKLIFTNLVGGEVEELCLPVEGSVKKFTVTLNLEKGRVEVIGHGKKGFFSYQITPAGLQWRKGEHTSLPFIKPVDLAPSKLRLSLGVKKKQEWDQVQARGEMKEVFPFWLKLASLIPEQPLSKKKWGALQLLPDLERAFQAGFQGILCPTTKDHNHLGLVPEEEVPGSVSPLPLLHAGAKQILSLFFSEVAEKVALLPALPKEFDAGKLTGAETKEGTLFDLEWSKRKLKKVVIHPKADGEIQLALPRGANAFRVNKRDSWSSKKPLSLKKGQRLFLDRF